MAMRVADLGGGRRRKTKLERSVDAATVRVRAGKSTIKADTGDITPKLRTPAARKLKSSVNRETARVKTGAGRVRVATGDTLTAADKRRAGKSKVAVTQSGIVPGEGSLRGALKGAKNLGADVLHLPQTVVSGAVETVSAAAEAVTGDTKRAKRLIKGIEEHDPFYLTGDAVVKGLKGDAAGSKKAFGKAVDEAAAHPGLATLEAIGAKGSVGKGITRVQRRLGKNPTKRASAKLPNSELEQPRKYTEDAFQRAADKVRERQKIRKADTLRAHARSLEAKDPAAHANEINASRAKANQADPRVMTDKQVKVRAARRAAADRAVTERNQVAVAKQVRAALKPAGAGRHAKPTAAHTLTAQSLVDATPESLRAYQQRLAAVHDSLSPAEQLANRELRAQIEEALKANHSPAEVVAGTERYKSVVRPLQKQLVDEGVLPKARANKAPLVPYAVAHMEGVVPGKRGPMRPATAAYYKQSPVAVARAASRKADKTLEKAVAAHAKAVGRAQIMSRNVDGVETPRSGYSGGARAVNEAKAALDAARTTAIAARKARVKAEHEWKAGARARRFESSGTKGMVKVKAGEIRAHARARGVAEPVFVTQRASSKTVGAQARLGHPNVPGATRTGKSTITGFNADPKVLVETARNTQRLVDLSRSYESTLKEFAHAPSRGKLSRDRAQQLARELQAKDGVEYVAVPDKPFAGDATIARTIDDAVGMDSPDVLLAIGKALSDAYAGKAGVKGTYSIIPRAAADELRAQAASSIPHGPINTTLKGTSSLFRRTVLATSPTWFAGNAIEGAMRSMIAGVRPGDKQLFRKIVAELEKTDPRLAQELRARVAGGGHYQAADRMDRAGILHQYNDTAVKPVAQMLQRFWEKSAPKAAAGLWSSWTHLVFNQLSGRMESSIQSSMAGAALRRGHLIDDKALHHIIRVNDKAVEQAAHGLTNTNEQAALGEAVARMYGRYDGFTADTRHAISTYTPFAAWAYNAANFVLHVLPADHPTAVALAVLQERANRQIREDAKLDELPDWLKGSIPLSGGRKSRVIRYTPFGAFTAPLETGESMVLPQFTGVLAAMRGEDWKGKKLRDENGQPLGGGGLSLKAAEAFLEATVPLYGKIKQISKNIDENGTVGGVAKTLNPFAPIGPPPAKTTRTPGATTDDGAGIDFSTYEGGGVSGIDFSTYGSP